MVESGPNGVTVGINDNNDVFARKGMWFSNYNLMTHDYYLYLFFLVIKSLIFFK